MALCLIQKELPYGEKSSRRSICRIADNMFRFWYRFVPENSSIIARGAADLAYRRIAPHLSHYIGAVFEDICKQYLWKLLVEGLSPIEFSDLGRWRGTDPSTHSQTEIDLMGEQGKATALFAECKWTQENADTSVLQTLVNRSRFFHYRHVHFFLFPKTGFTSGCRNAAEEIGSVTLVTYKEMLDLFQNL